MKKPTLFLLVASLFIASPVMADIDGNKLLDNCQDAITYWESKNSLSVNFSSVNFCIGYISGANDLHKTFVSSVGCFDPPLYCKPSSYTVEQLVRTVVNFLKNHPEDLHFQGSVLTMAALKEALPCP